MELERQRARISRICSVRRTQSVRPSIAHCWSGWRGPGGPGVTVSISIDVDLVARRPPPPPPAPLCISPRAFVLTALSTTAGDGGVLVDWSTTAAGDWWQTQRQSAVEQDRGPSAVSTVAPCRSTPTLAVPGTKLTAFQSACGSFVDGRSRQLRSSVASWSPITFNVITFIGLLFSPLGKLAGRAIYFTLRFFLFFIYLF